MSCMPYVVIFLPAACCMSTFLFQIPLTSLLIPRARRGDARYTKSIYALLSRSIVWSLLCYCVRDRNHCCVLCDVTRDLLLTWYIVHQPQDAYCRAKCEFHLWGRRDATNWDKVVKLCGIIVTSTLDIWQYDKENLILCNDIWCVGGFS